MAHSSSSSGLADTIAFSMYAELRREFDMLQGKYDRLIDRLRTCIRTAETTKGSPKSR